MSNELAATDRAGIFTTSGQGVVDFTDDRDKLIQRVLDRVRSLIERFDDPATPYLVEPAPQWAPRFSDYRHLERVAAREDEE